MKSSPHFLSIDVFKALGIIFLVILHQMVWLYTFGDTGGLVFEEAYYLIVGYAGWSGLHVLGFGIPLLAGTTFYLSSPHKSFIEIVNRSLALFILGTLMNLLAWGPSGIFDWDVLQFLSVVMLLAYFLLRLPMKISIVVLSVMAFVAIYLSNQFLFAEYEANYFYQITLGSTEGENYWPLFPWISVFIAGIFLGMILKNGSKKVYQMAVGVGVILFMLAIVSGKFFPVYDTERIWGAALFKPSPFFVIGIIGFFIFAVPAFELVIAKNQQIRKLFEKSWVTYYSRGILWIYMITIIVGYGVTMNIVHQFFEFDFVQSLFILGVLAAFHLAYSYQIGNFIVHRQAPASKK